jgi:hypothetical protein
MADGGDVEAWEGTSRVDPEEEKEHPVGLGLAIANATEKARVGLTYEVSRIQVEVGNPGPTAYRVIITPSGG